MKKEKDTETLIRKVKDEKSKLENTNKVNKKNKSKNKNNNKTNESNKIHQNKKKIKKIIQGYKSKEDIRKGIEEDEKYKIDDVIKKQKEKNENADVEKIRKAYEYAKEKHEGQLRNSGAEYITHPVNVAYILANLGLDDETVAAALLHDVLEDTKASKEDLIREFGETIYEMVEGVTKLGNLKYKANEEVRDRQVENYRKMFLAMGKDIRIILIKLADRLHNMRTLRHKVREKQMNISKETLDIYAPLANRLGIHSFKGELEDLSFKYLMPEEYSKVIRSLDKNKDEREEYLTVIKKDLEEKINKTGIKANISGRTKRIYSIYKKMRRDNVSIDQIYDIFAFRIIVGTTSECYRALGVLHDAYTPILGRFKDYIAVPKQNMYQSIHTTVIADKKGKPTAPFEVQIRTENMHKVAEFGIAAHWAYKEANYKGQKATVSVKEDKLSWVRETIEWQKDTQDPEQFMESLKTELFEDEVYIYTPKGDIKMLPKGSNPIDVAYLIHEEIGNRMTGARINSKMVPITTELKNGDIVEIITSDNSRGPSSDWVKQAKTPGARNKITKWFRKERKEENSLRGKEIIEKEISKLGHKPFELMKYEWLENISEKLGFLKIEDMYAAIGFGTLGASKIVQRLNNFYEKENEEQILEDKLNELEEGKTKSRQPNSTKAISNKALYVKGLENCLINIGKCCNPVPGDEIIGYITQGRGVTVHRTNCHNAKDILKDEFRTIEVFWGEEQSQNYPVEIEIYSIGKKDLLKDLLNIIEKNDCELVAVDTRQTESYRLLTTIKIVVKNYDELNKIINNINLLDSVYDVKRKIG